MAELTLYMNPIPDSRYGGSGSPSPLRSMAAATTSPPSTGRELDAARALAGLADMAAMESGGGGGEDEAEAGGMELGKMGKLRGKQIEDEWPSRASAIEPKALLLYKRRVAVCSHEEELKAGERQSIEQHSEQSRRGNNDSIRHTQSSNTRGKQTITEAEKEAKRIRRVLANRESARQTIRRRQAFREELGRKVADLSLDNHNIKMEKELMMKEYLSLKDTNKHLKGEIAKASKREAKPSSRVSSVQAPALSSSSTEPGLLACRPPYMPYPWRTWLSFLQNTRPCLDQGNPYKVCEAGPPSYMPLCAWFYSVVPHQPSGSCSHCAGPPGGQDVDSTVKQHGSSEDLEVRQGKRIFDTEEEKGSTDSHKRIEIGSGEDGLMFGSHPEANKTSNSSSTRTVDCSSNVKGGPRTEHGNRAVQEQPQPMFSGTPEKLVDVTPATTARKRRKELTKLKHPHGRHFTLHS